MSLPWGAPWRAVRLRHALQAVRVPPCRGSSALRAFLCLPSALYKGDKRCYRPLHASGRGGGSVMTFEEILDHAIAMLQRRGRLTYGTLKRQFQLDDAALEDLKDEILFAYPQAHDEEGRGLIWTGDAGTVAAAASAPAATPAQEPLAYTPPY